ncbi:hypothetical protein FIBSPDRAFT_552034 [Athelia psychrophila]|uniref:Uncharacterized protein n=1 Tax=Athelia psychrophila TaxID=1759441 RepID=A0A166UW83_9AGAM|nr:hypothetical protein FIBSPDRAFT_552034 [Fibularhizoctonia sp. CBS 109695]
MPLHVPSDSASFDQSTAALSSSTTKSPPCMRTPSQLRSQFTSAASFVPPRFPHTASGVTSLPPRLAHTHATVNVNTLTKDDTRIPYVTGGAFPQPVYCLHILTIQPFQAAGSHRRWEKFGIRRQLSVTDSDSSSNTCSRVCPRACFLLV